MDAFIGDIPAVDAAREKVRQHYLADETEIVRARADAARLPPELGQRITARATALVEEARARARAQGGLDAFLHEYALSSAEGVVLMCLAEALLRIPDDETADLFIRDKLAGGDWEAHLGHSGSLLVNASTWGLMLTGRIIALDHDGNDLPTVLGRLVARSGEPLIRQSMIQAMRILGRQFVMGRTIGEALERASEHREAGDRHSFDMLGEAARTAADAERYFDAYADAISAIGHAAGGGDVFAGPGISVKLSAVFPRYEYAQRRRVMERLVPRLIELALAARDAGIGLTIDAEEANRLEISLDVLDAALGDKSLAGWDGLGLAVQAYQKRAVPLLAWLSERAAASGRRLPVRLVKGAYWDSEIKRAQEAGLPGYPVFTRKASTDVSYIACAQRLLAEPERFYPQFATHNAHTAATVIELALESGAKFEFQRLHGMGEELHGQFVDEFPVRVYAPVGSHEDLLPYLVRRLLENGANTSFVNRLIDENSPVEAMVADPVVAVDRLASLPHPGIPLPADIFPDGRRNSAGADLSDPQVLAALAGGMMAAASANHQAGPVIGGKAGRGRAREVRNPADSRRVVGHVVEATPAQAAEAVAAASKGFRAWDSAGGAARADILEEVAERLEADRDAFMALSVREAGRSLPDSLSEVREAVDFCRYYAAQARRDFERPLALPGPTGESNALSLRGRGVFVCISPWNFPLAIFTGQVAAALAAGNAVVAKPAEQTPLIAARIVRLMHEAGVPDDVLQLVPGDGEIGAVLVGHADVAGVAFTGSTETARAINRVLAARDGAIVPLIAETGGQNAMIVDSSALTEQVVGDVITSAFLSAGQRCSALRVLFVQDDIADRTLEMLCGAMAELALGDPALIETDVGPVIDRGAVEMLEAHAARMDGAGRLLYRCELPAACEHGSFFAPRAYEIPSLSILEREVFGPILHVIRYDDRRLDDVLEAVRNTGYGLTLGVHSRIQTTIDRITRALPVGNAYVNRSMVGAVVGVQPFGGEGLSGTGPKAGGPHYLYRLAVERALSVNTVAMGGNTTLLSLDDTADG